MAKSTKRKKTPGSGRKKGTPNKLTKAFKLALDEVLEEGKTQTRLRALRDSRSAIDRATFWRLAARRIPMQVEGKFDGLPLLTVIDYSDQREEGGENGEG